MKKKTVPQSVNFLEQQELYRVVNQYQLYKPRKISFREIKMECMHDESANRLPGTIIRRAGNRPSQATLHEI